MNSIDPHTALTVGEQSSHKPLRRFGSASVRKPVSEGIAKAVEQDARPDGARAGRT